MAENGESDEIKFYKPKLRFIIPIEDFHCPKKLFNEFKNNNYTFKINYDFPKVIDFCKKIKRKDKNTWINNIIANTYEELNRMGFCHSVECYENENLIGGLYGVHLGSVFFGESMFSLKTNTSKYCLLYLITILKKNKFSLLDSQFYNPHLLQFGAFEIDSTIYEDILKKSLVSKTSFKSIENFYEVLSLLQPSSQRS